MGQGVAQCGASYLVGTPKAMLKQFERSLLEEDNWSKIEPGVEVKSCASPEGSQERFVLCRSPLRREKEKAMRWRQVEKLEKELGKMQASTRAAKRALRDRDKALERLGRLRARYSRAARFVEVKIEEMADPHEKKKKRLSIQVRRKENLDEWAVKTDGCYLLRTNLADQNAESLWRTYMGLVQIEDSFRITKHDLGLRPIFHHNQERIQAHILVCFLSLVLWRTLQQWMEGSGLGSAPRKLLEEMAEVRSVDVVLPNPVGPELRLRTVSRPEPHLAILLERLKFHLPNRPKQIQNAVATLSAKNEKPEQPQGIRL